MTTETFPPLYSRLDPEMTARTRRALQQAKATKAQSAIEYILFAVFGATILIAAIALIITNTSTFRRVPNSVAQGIAADRVNILVMQTYKNRKTEAVDAEALMLVSVKPSTHEVAVTSIPRDLWVKLGKYGERRLGLAPAVGKSAGYPGEGTGLTADTVQETLGQKVHAYISLDRKDLIAAVDALGGIDINIEQSFFEYRQRERYLRGRHHLSGEQAVQFGLSHAILGPANDRFAREARQQQVIAALAAKASATQGLASIASGDRTNLTSEQIAWLSGTINGREPRRVTLAPYMDTFEVTTFADAGEAVRPRGGDFHQVQQIVANVFSQTAIAAN